MSKATGLTALQWPEEEAEAPSYEPDILSELVLTAQRFAGELLWLSQRTRPDLAFGVNAACASAVTKPEQSVVVSEAIMRFLVGRPNLALTYYSMPATEKTP